MASLLTDNVDNGELVKRENEYYDGVRAGFPCARAQLAYAKLLVRSKYRTDLVKGVQHFLVLFSRNDQIEAAECLLFLGIGYARLMEYQESLKYLQLLLKVEPTHRDALALEEEVRMRLRSDGMRGMLLMGAIVAAATAMLGFCVLRCK